MNNDVLTTILITLLSGGLIGAIFTGMTTRSAIEKNNASAKQINVEALETYQKIANLASASDLASQIREKESEKRLLVYIDELKSEAKERLSENSQLKHVVSTWSTGIEVLHSQLKSLEQIPRWAPNADDLKFLDK